MSKVADAGARSGPLPPGAKITKTPADPAPTLERAQWIFDLRFDKGEVFLLGVHRFELPAPQLTPRAMGRFAVELFEGPALIERVRFDFPMLGAGDSQRGDAGKWTPSFEKKLVSRIGVMFPATSRGTRLELWDRATDTRWTLPWPPVDTRSDGGAGVSAGADSGAGAGVDAGARRDGG
jgi:hypothetical protein